MTIPAKASIAVPTWGQTGLASVVEALGDAKARRRLAGAGPVREQDAGRLLKALFGLQDIVALLRQQDGKRGVDAGLVGPSRLGVARRALRGDAVGQS